MGGWMNIQTNSKLVRIIPGSVAMIFCAQCNISTIAGGLLLTTAVWFKKRQSGSCDMLALALSLT
ncbi:hypothetical protein T11_14705 [Trichinella zimbabwensis]|uniref:Uncharacterized protein n=1 Tax=Trichinella zimbabwensis TaxID=268475 RepID=A0A0V1GEY2_9BILA|nr:hypothetical protein T11_14705 [Trichinella zimbabwensis]